MYVYLIVLLPTIVCAHKACRRISLGWRTPAISMTGASCAAVLPTFLLQLLQPEIHHLLARGLDMQNKRKDTCNSWLTYNRPIIMN